MYKNILVVMEATEVSFKSLDHAIYLASTFEAKITLIAIIPIVTLPFFPDDILTQDEALREYEENIKEVYDKVLCDAKEKISLASSSIDVDTIIGEGRVLTNIETIANKNGCDLVIMGVRDIGRWMYWRLFDNSMNVISSCTIPIMTIKEEIDASPS